MIIPFGQQTVCEPLHGSVQEFIASRRSLTRPPNGRTVTLVKDASDVDRYGRLLRYVYVGETFVNRELVAQGYAEAVLYEPDDRHYREFRRLERAAAEARLACHQAGIFQDGDPAR